MITSGGLPYTEQIASAIPAAGPLGADFVQDAMDLLAAAGSYYTTYNDAAYTLGSGGTYTTLLAFPIAAGTVRSLDCVVNFRGGTSAAPTSLTGRIVATARRTAGGTVQVSTPASLTSLSLSGFNIAWEAAATTVLLRFRATGAPTVNATLLYSWLEKTYV